MQKEEFEIPSWMQQKKPGEPLQAPEGYFESLEQELLRKTKTRSLPVQKTWIYYSSLAVAAMAVLSIGFLWLFQPETPIPSAELNKLSQEELLQAIEEEDISTSTVTEIAAAALSEEQLLALQEFPDANEAPIDNTVLKPDSPEQYLPNKAENANENASLENYLLETADINDIIDAL